MAPSVCAYAHLRSADRHPGQESNTRIHARSRLLNLECAMRACVFRPEGGPLISVLVWGSEAAGRGRSRPA